MKKTLLNLSWQVGLCALIVALDRIVKLYILNNFAVGEIFGTIPYVTDFMYVQNTGAAFSIFSNNTVLLALVSVLFLIALILYSMIKKPQHFMENLAISLFFAGGLGNAIDRVQYKFVVDFIDIKWFDFPVFNIADIAVVLGAVSAIVYVVFYDKNGDKVCNK